MSLRRCRTCKIEKSTDVFSDPQAKRCDACWEEVRRNRCANCGGPAGTKANGRTPRQYCRKPECTEAKQRTNAAEYRKQLRVQMADKRAHTCPACLENKPLTEEHWAPLTRASNGRIERFDSYCRECRYALQRDRYKTDERIREQSLARAAERRERENARRLEDPEFDQLIKARRQRWNKTARLRAKTGPARPVSRRDDSRLFPTLPAAPLAAALIQQAGLIEAYSLRDTGRQLEAISMKAGISARTLYAWESGERTRVQFDVAERILIELSLCWWDVWPDDENVRKVFEGDQVAA